MTLREMAEMAAEKAMQQRTGGVSGQIIGYGPKSRKEHIADAIERVAVAFAEAVLKQEHADIISVLTKDCQGDLDYGVHLVRKRTGPAVVDAIIEVAKRDGGAM